MAEGSGPWKVQFPPGGRSRWRIAVYILGTVAIVAGALVFSVRQWMGIRAAVMHVVSEAHACSVLVEQHVAAREALPADERDMACGASSGRGFTDLRVRAGRVEATLRDIQAGIDGTTVVLIPVTGPPGGDTKAPVRAIQSWRCTYRGSSDAATFLPMGCRTPLEEAMAKPG